MLDRLFLFWFGDQRRKYLVLLGSFAVSQLACFGLSLTDDDYIVVSVGVALVVALVLSVVASMSLYQAVRARMR